VSELRFGIAGAGMIATVHRDGTRPQVDGHEARKAVGNVRAVYESARRGGTAVAPDRGRAP